MNDTWIIIQARTSSRRLPEKVIKEIGGAPLISHVIRRARHSKCGNNICLATTVEKEDGVLADIGRTEGVYVFRGDKEDVLSRYYFCAKELNAKNIIRVTGDCPLIDPKVIDKVVDMFFTSKADYASNIHPPTFPDGLDTEIFSMQTLERANKCAERKYEREHVTPFIWENKDIFTIVNYFNEINLDSMRWTVDQEEDMRFVREIYRRAGTKGNMFY